MATTDPLLSPNASLATCCNSKSKVVTMLFPTFASFSSSSFLTLILSIKVLKFSDKFNFFSFIKSSFISLTNPAKSMLLKNAL